MDDEKMVYVAEDPQQPGAAWAIAADHPAMKESLADEMADWIRKGAIVKRVTAAEGKEMFLRWQMPAIPGEQISIAV